MKTKFKIKDYKNQKIYVYIDSFQFIARHYLKRHLKKENCQTKIKGYSYKNLITGHSKNVILHELVHYYYDKYLIKDLYDNKYYSLFKNFIDSQKEINKKRFAGNYLKYRNKATEIIAWYCEYVLLGFMTYPRNRKECINYLKEIKKVYFIVKDNTLTDKFIYYFFKLLAKYKFFSTLWRIYEKMEEK